MKSKLSSRKGDAAFVTYSCVRTDGTRFRNTEFFRVKSGLVAQVEVYFGSETAERAQEAELRTLLEQTSAAVRAKDAAKLRAEIRRRLPFEPELMICPARDLRALASGDPFRDAPAGKDVTRFVSVIRKPLRTSPRLPIEQPAGDKWEVRIVAITGRFVLSLRRPGRTRVYSNAIVEKHLGVPATTRNWNTIATIAKVLAP